MKMKMKMTTVAPTLLVISLSACGSGSGTDSVADPGPTVSAFGDGSNLEAFRAYYQDAADQEEQTYYYGDGGERAFYAAIGYFETETDDRRYFGVATLSDNTLTHVDAGPTTGSITYETRYWVGEATDVASEPDLPDDFIEGVMSVTADFDTHAITGTSDLLTIDGQIADSGTGFEGDVTWRGVEGEISGVVGDQVWGAFHGDNEDTVFAGALIGNPNTP